MSFAISSVKSKDLGKSTPLKKRKGVSGYMGTMGLCGNAWININRHFNSSAKANEFTIS